MKIYLDNCCFNRPYDDQSNIRIRLETEAKLYIQDLIKKGNLRLVWSYILDFENAQNPFDEKRLRIKKWQDFANEDVEENQEILKNARRLNSIGLRRMDCLHVACAIYAKCDYFITTDKGILKKSNKIREIIIIDPINFIRELEDVD